MITPSIAGLRAGALAAVAALLLSPAVLAAPGAGISTLGPVATVPSPRPAVRTAENTKKSPAALVHRTQTVVIYGNPTVRVYENDPRLGGAYDDVDRYGPTSVEVDVIPPPPHDGYYDAYDRGPVDAYAPRYRDLPPVPVERGTGPGVAVAVAGGSIAVSKRDHAERWEACDERYRSFRWSDGTFQPYGHRPRQLCPYLR